MPISGRPEKLPDVCYSWWVLASLKIIGRLHWIDKVGSVHEVSAMYFIFYLPKLGENNIPIQFHVSCSCLSSVDLTMKKNLDFNHGMLGKRLPI